MSATEVPSVAVCICTFKRPDKLQALLSAIGRQVTRERFKLSIVVVDNDGGGSAKKIVEQAQETLHLAVDYIIQPTRNIALARNTAVSRATGEMIAFIDDDEIPPSSWLDTLYTTLDEFKVDGVLGPVLPDYEVSPPRWVRTGRFYDRPRYLTGTTLRWEECRTGNVLMWTGPLRNLVVPFQEEFGTGGEDQDFFRRAIEAGGKFVWCDEAPVWEAVPTNRLRAGFLLKRALLRGKNSFQHKSARKGAIFKSIVAVPLYTAAICALAVCWPPAVMKYSVKLMDHVGRLLASVGIKPIAERPM